MVQFFVLSGRHSGHAHSIKRFPCVVGRADSAQIRIQESGVWDRHMVLELNESNSFILKVLPGAVASVNSQPFQEGVLRNGDVIDVGSVQLQFRLTETSLKNLRSRECATWAALAAVAALQIGLIYWLLL